MPLRGRGGTWWLSEGCLTPLMPLTPRLSRAAGAAFGDSLEGCLTPLMPLTPWLSCVAGAAPSAGLLDGIERRWRCWCRWRRWCRLAGAALGDSLHIGFPASLLFLLLCLSDFSAFCFPCFFAFLLLCFPCCSAFVLLCLSTSTILLFPFFSHVLLLLYFLLLCFFASCLYQ